MSPEENFVFGIGQRFLGLCRASCMLRHENIHNTQNTYIPMPHGDYQGQYVLRAMRGERIVYVDGACVPEGLA